MDGRICLTCCHEPTAHMYANSPQRPFITGRSAPVSPCLSDRMGQFIYKLMTDSFTLLSFSFFLFCKQLVLSTKLLVCTFFLTRLSLRSWNRVARHRTHLLWTSTNKLSSPLDLDRLRWDWWLWLESGISERPSSPLTIFYKLLPVVNVVAPAPSVSVTEGWKHTYAPWSQFHNMSWGLRRTFQGVQWWDCRQPFIGISGGSMTRRPIAGCCRGHCATFVKDSLLF